MKRFKSIAHTADLAYEIIADSPEEIFLSGLSAWLEATFGQKTFTGSEIKKLHLNASDLEGLLVEFLNEINFLCHHKQWIAVKAEGKLVTEGDNTLSVKMEITGEKQEINYDEIQNDIKAATYHQLKIQQKDGKFRTKLIFDI